MLSFLLDEQISPAVSEQLASLRPDIPVVSLREWSGGAYLGTADEVVLRAAALEALTLVTYDLKTIPLVLAQWGAEDRPYAGVIFVDNRTISSNDFGGLIRALVQLWDEQYKQDWTSRVDYLRRPPL